MARPFANPQYYFLAAGMYGVMFFVPRRFTLYQIDHGTIPYPIRPETRLGAYQITANYPEGTVGNTAHRAIGTIYILFGSKWEDDIGLLFHEQETKDLYPQLIGTPAEAKLNEIEYNYWEQQKDLGGELACLFKPSVRRWIQVHVFFREYNIVAHIEKWLRNKL